MQNKHFKFLIIALAVAIIIPQITLAAWWNPFSWGVWSRIFHFQKTIQNPLGQQNQNIGNNTNVSDPKLTFINIRSELDKAQDINTYLGILLRTSATEKKSEIEKSVNSFIASSGNSEALVFLKGVVVPINAITITNEKIDGDTATLNGSFQFTKDNSQYKGTGTVTMKMENGVWKVYLEKWNYQ